MLVLLTVKEWELVKLVITVLSLFSILLLVCVFFAYEFVASFACVEKHSLDL